MIQPFAAGSFTTQLNTERLVATKAQFNDLGRQLTTGKVAQTYGGLGLGQRADLSAHAQIAALDGYDTAIDAGQLRLKLQTQSVEAISKSVGTAKASLLTQYKSGAAVARATTQATMSGAFDAALDALNQNVAGRYLFAGTATDVQPVADRATILEGDAATGAAGLKAVIAERKAADRGVLPEIGRLTPAVTGSAVTLSESTSASVRDNFGFTITGATSTSTAITAARTAAKAPTTTLGFAVGGTATQPKDGDVVRLSIVQPDGSQKLADFTARAPGAGTLGAGEFAIGADAATSAANLQAAANRTLGPGATARVASAQSASPPGVTLGYSGADAPGSAAFTVASQPADGARVTVSLRLHDGSPITLTLTARAAGVTLDSAKEFAIGATTDATAANLKAALGAALGGAADTDLAAASAVSAANDFFAGSSNPALAPRRIVGPTADPGAATGFAGTPAAGKTVIWYRGEDAPDADPRASAPVQVDRSGIVGTGARANEAGFRLALASFGVLAADAGGAAGTEDARYTALTSRVTTALTAQPAAKSVDAIGTDLAQASVALADAKTRHGTTRAVLQDAVSGIEDASPDVVAAQLLSLQTTLQASYQTTSMLSKLSLTNYL